MTKQVLFDRGKSEHVSLAVPYIDKKNAGVITADNEGHPGVIIPWHFSQSPASAVSFLSQRMDNLSRYFLLFMVNHQIFIGVPKCSQEAPGLVLEYPVDKLFSDVACLAEDEGHRARYLVYKYFDEVDAGVGADDHFVLDARRLYLVDVTNFLKAPPDCQL